MKRYLWTTTIGNWMYTPFAIVGCYKEVANKIEKLRSDNLWMYIASKLYERYPDKFPKWFDSNVEKHSFWYDNVLEKYKKAYNRLVEERIEMIKGSFDDETFIHEAKWRVEEELESLPKFMLI